MGIMNRLRRAADLSGVRRVILYPPVRRQIARTLMLRFLIAAKEVDQPGVFLCNSIRRRGAASRYTIKATGVPVMVRNGVDTEALYELFSRGEYQPPAPFADRLSQAKVHRVLDVGANVGMFSAWATVAPSLSTKRQPPPRKDPSGSMTRG
ncbi:hypothetical protein K0651_07305 [Ornithinimicrobium sp. Arc0846-15]|nr:hypothetical protein [Ornithinimicrobium laminariae]